MNLSDLARQLNVSTATVSRALSRPEVVSPATRKQDGALLALRRQQIKVPRDLSLIGFDDARWAQYCDPPLTVISQPTDAMGRKAAELLLGRINGKPASETIVFEPGLVIRRSTAIPKTYPVIYDGIQSFAGIKRQITGLVPVSGRITMSRLNRARRRLQSELAAAQDPEVRNEL